MYIDALAKHYNFSVDTPVEELPRIFLTLYSMAPTGKKLK